MSRLLGRQRCVLRSGRAVATHLLTWTSLAAVALVASLPFLPLAPPRSIDGLLHLYRLVELDQCLSQGALYPRWAPDLAQGYGFPLFHYYPPLAYYIAEAWHLAGFSLARALSLTYMTAALLSTVGMYLLAREWAGEVGGVVAALLYTNAPFTLQNAVRRGGLAEVLAWAIAPLVLWSFRRLAMRWRARYLVGASLSLGAFILAHHLSALTLMPLLALLLIGTALEARNRQALVRPLPALVLGAGLSAFFAAPAYLERGFVQIERVYASAGFDYHYFFEPLRSLLSGPVSIDVSLLNAPVPRSIGWIQAGLAVCGTVAALARRSWRGWYVGAFLAALGLLLMTQHASVRIWELFSILRYLQFPWRLLAPLGLLLALSGSGTALLIAEGRRRWVTPTLLSAVALGLYLYNTPLLYAGRHPLPSPNPTVADLLEFERTYWLPSLTSNYDYLPIWVSEPPAESPVGAQHAASSAVRWLEEGSLPPGSQVLDQECRLNDLRFRIITPEPARLVVNQFYFPGWQAYIDGTPQEVQPVPPSGLIGVDLPAGEHTLWVCFRDTPLRRAAGAASLLSAFALIGVAWGMRRQHAAEPKDGRAESALSPRGWALLLATTAGYLALKATAIDRYGLGFWTCRFDGTGLRGAGSGPVVNLGGEMQLLGVEPSERRIASGSELTVRLYWRALRRMGAEYSTSLVLVDGEGHVWGQKDSQHPGGYPTVRWETNAYVADEHRLQVFPGAPPGTYTLQVGAYDLRSGRQLDVIDERGAPAGTAAAIGEVEVTRPASPPDPADLGITRAIGVPLGRDLELLGASLPDTPLFPGARLRFTLFWRALRQPAAEYLTLASFGDASSPGSWQAAFPTGGPAYPTTAWKPGEIIRAQHDLLVPGDTPPGNLSLWIALQTAGGPACPPVEVGTVQVLPIERRWEIPPMQVALGARFGPILLLGYDLDRHEVRRGEALHLRLYWQAAEPITEEYTVFTHLLDAQERISAQKDSVPASGTRPTTSWAPQEVIIDDYELLVREDATTGLHRLELGLYEPRSGRRLPLRDAEGRGQGDNLRADAITVLP